MNRHLIRKRLRRFCRVKIAAMPAPAMAIIIALYTMLGNPAVASDLIFGDGFDPPPELSVSTSTPQSLERVELNGIPAEWQTPGDVTVEFVNVAESRPMPVELDGSGWFITAPFHPTFPEQGGTVSLRAVRGQTPSMPFSLELRPLPDAPGAFQELVDTLRAHIDGFARQRGSSLEALQAMTFEDTPDALFPLKYAQSFVDDPENPNSLAFIADGTSNFLSAGERRFIDQIAGATALADLIALEVDALGDLQSQVRVASIGVASGDFTRRTVAINGAQASGAIPCIDAGPTIGDAATLSAAMWEAKFAEIAISGDPGKTLTRLSATLAAGSVIPVFGNAFLAAGAATAAWQASRGALAGLNPSQFESISVSTTRQRFEEDSEAFGEFSDVRVVASSTGWIVDQAIVDAVITALGAVGDSAKATITQAEFLTASAVETINVAVSNHVGAREDGVVRFCPQKWEVDIPPPNWSEARSVFGHFEVGGRTFKPTAVEDDFLSISPIAEKFGQEKIDIDIPIGVDPIEVTATPMRIPVTQPGEVKNITATIEHALDESLFWDPGPGSWNDGGLEPTNGGGTRPLKTPANPDAYPFLVEIESLSRGGFRADNEPRRIDSVQVVLVDEIIVSPANACLENGRGEQFTATQGDEPASVVWSLESTGNSPANLGSITQSGRYTAPGSGSGEVLIVATSVDDPDIRGVALVEVGSCECFWSLSIAGEGAWSGREAFHFFPIDGAPSAQFTLAFGTETGTVGGNAQIFRELAPTPGQTGTFPIDTFGFGTASRTWVVTADPDDDTSATLLVEENIDEVVMTGSIGGTVLTFINNEEILQNFDLNFRSAGIDGSCGDEF